MNGLIIKVLSISIAVVTVVYLIIYKGNTMITKIFSVCIRSVYKELHADRETGC